MEDSVITSAQAVAERSNAPPKSVSYVSTRLPTANAPRDDIIPPSPSLSAIDAAISGRPKPTASESGYSGAETPRVNGYAFVDAEPTPSEIGIPVTDEEADAAEREAAMQFLPKIDTEGGTNPFNLKERSKREDLHLRLVEKADAGRRKEKGTSRLNQLRDLGITPGRTPTPKFASAPKRGGMTPAAQRLAGRIATPRREGDVFAAGLRSTDRSWTPTPRLKRQA